jgi:hypothetical protein
VLESCLNPAEAWHLTPPGVALTKPRQSCKGAVCSYPHTHGCPLLQPYTKAALTTTVVQHPGDGGSVVVRRQLQISATDSVRRVQRFESWVVRPRRRKDPEDAVIVIEGWVRGECPKQHPACPPMSTTSMHKCRYCCPCRVGVTAEPSPARTRLQDDSALSCAPHLSNSCCSCSQGARAHEPLDQTAGASARARVALGRSCSTPWFHHYIM